MKMTKELVYKSAMLRYGIDNQILMVFEKMIVGEDRIYHSGHPI